MTVYNIEYYRLKRKNDELLNFIGETVNDKLFLENNVQTIKRCIIDWQDSQNKLSALQEGEKNVNSRNVRSA